MKVRYSIGGGLISQVLLDLINSLEKQNDFRFLEPWRYSSESLALIIPIVRVRYDSREYIVLDEFPSILSIRDAGSVGKVVVENNSDRHVFVRGGCVLEGLTQPRALRYSVLVESETSCTVDVVCVHETSPIRRGSELRPSFYVPLKLKSIVSKGSQNEVWNSIMLYSLEVLHRETSNLTEVIRHVERSKNRIADIIEKFPMLKDQVGIIVVDTKGIEVLEIFDHPKSWNAIAKNVGKEIADILAEEQEMPLFKPDIKAVMESIRMFLHKIRECRELEVFKGKQSYTKLLEGKGIVGEYTVLNNNIVHLMITRTEKPYTKPRMHIESYARRAEAIQEYLRQFMKEAEKSRRNLNLMHIFMMLMSNIYNMDSRKAKTLLKVLETLGNKSLTWAEIVEKLAKEVSPATISRRLKNGIAQGLIAKTLRENGKPAYTLTAKGIAFIEKVKKKKDLVKD